ncbi:MULTISPECIES: MotA/TolQ/ExbB proton channel family protein [unclassified Oceanispirochaeta]|uniref:MotA/TolQ/ExbB proton channel family protein n=1 Tax=unclassified Oceanispirochaeta TaxID=2635722 RepID=UPI000E09D38F|nr:MULTISPECIES: MotA/TolQ/ExbB proton channel family protein [unclassified Oceanispirochaeta]MBF9015080.1 MotA/TolQ/ExbB proton channel family protein [Oceanispirochaeta sp. M2]NPD71538.1 MotA/TolQ/ExbB proton channel family protein [Oceanispirochaeta sp. M1]RDG33109.1 MotA/TolQ/ExbB proton channel family protein [Oceanispirochaeta sp. M1]
MTEQWSLIRFFEMGGVFMWPLLVFSILTVGFILERVLYILIHDLKTETIRKDILDFSEKGKLTEADAYLAQLKPRNVSGRILKEVLKNAPYGEHRMEKAVEAEGQEQIRKLENGFNFLSALASIAPLTGFLGTVSGMIGAFRSIAEATDVNAQLVANGIYEALLTTVFGLIIAIIALVGYNILAHRVDTFAADITKASSDIVGALTIQSGKL